MEVFFASKDWLVDRTSTLGYIYIWEANPGSKKSDNAWVITRIDLTTLTSKVWFSILNKIQNSWDDRLILNY